MQVVEGWTSLAERVGPLVGLPVASALVVTLLWALTGWSWFDLGPWPWALGAVPIALLGLGRLLAGQARRQRAHDAIVELGTAFSALSHSVPASSKSAVLAALRLARTRYGREGLQPLDDILDDATLADIRQAEDPLLVALDAVSARSAASKAQLDQVHAALARVDGASVPEPAGFPTTSLTALYLMTLPVGLVTTTGWWTFAAIAGVSLAFMALESAADGASRNLGLEGGVPVDRILDTVDRSLLRAISKGKTS